MGSALGAAQAQAQAPAVPADLSAPSDQVALTLQLEGMQLFECKRTAGSLNWTSNGARAALYKDGAIVGNYSNGPTWRHNDGSSLTGKLVISKDAPTPKDYPWQRFEVTSRGQGALSDVTAVVQIDTQKGLLQGPCEDENVAAGQPFRATYVFLKAKK
ncbi:MAG: DUF3455 domain-containing protein [Alphaproteobacteria bacterium]|nr:DUF3455 domain-containing protein [Alphaproteobacteria bacterium]